MSNRDSFLVPAKGKGKEIREYLQRELSIPAYCRSFTVKLEMSEVIRVECEYLATERKEPE